MSAQGLARQLVIALIVVVALGLPALFGVAVGIGLLVSRPVDDLPQRVDAILKAHGGTRVRLNDVPDQLSAALVAIEDERFYQHSGIDTQGLIRAILTAASRQRALQRPTTPTHQSLKIVCIKNNTNSG